MTILKAAETRSSQITRRLPVGAELIRAGGVHFRVWAPHRKRVEVVLDGGMATASLGKDSLIHELEQESTGYYSGLVPDATAGTLYRYRLDGAEAYPDPASRFQPEGPHGPSQVVDAEAFRWTDDAWRGVGLEGQVIYEMHIGTFTREGSWDAAARELRRTRRRRNHRAGDNARGRFLRPLRLGIRWRGPLCAHPPLRHARTIFVASSTGHTRPDLE